MEQWDGTVLDINATCADLGPQCLQLLGMHSISGCDTTSYRYAKGKFSALKTMLDGDFPGLDDVLGGVGATHEDLLIMFSNNVFPSSLRSASGDIHRICPFHIVHTEQEKS